MSSSRRIWVYHNNVWSKGSVSPQHAKKVLLDGHANPVSFAKKPTMPVKHNGRRNTKERAEVVPAKAVGPRPERFRVPVVQIEAVSYTRPGVIGDYAWQCDDEQQTDPTFGRALHVYNENMFQQMDKSRDGPGGGNAVARPYRSMGRSIGMPTGHYYGFTGLDDTCVGPNFELTAKEGIDMATDEIIMQVCDHPERYDKIYYCKNANDDEELIGMGIFHIEDETRRYITAKLKTLPSAIRKRAIDRRRAIRG